MSGRFFLYLIIVLITQFNLKGTELENSGSIQWNEAVELPSELTSPHPGLAGAFSGIHNGVLIIAGGANFPEDPPWEGGKKVWWDKIHVLHKTEGHYQWINNLDLRLDQGNAYGISIATQAGLLCIGGGNEAGIVSDIILLSWDETTQTLSRETLGKLPPDLVVNAGAMVNDEIFISGIIEGKNHLIKLNVEKLLEENIDPYAWIQLEGCPGPPRIFPAFATQSNGETTCLYLFGGRTVNDGKMKILEDGYFFNLKEKQWKPIENTPPVMAAPAMSYGANNILIFGGDDGKLLLERDEMERRIRRGPDQVEIDSLSLLLKNSFSNHPGFSQQVYAFNTITNSFQRIGSMPFLAPVTTNSVLWDDQIVLVSGEIKPGIRTPAIRIGEIERKAVEFGWINYIVLGCYFIVLVWIGFHFAGRQKSTNDYFKGGGRVPWWAAGLSVFGTSLSAITFMAIPAKTYATDWTYFFYNPTVLLVMPIVVFIFIPFYRKLNITTAYEYLEFRFNVSVRLFGSLSFILYQLGRIAIVLYLPAIALSLVTGVDIYLCILVVGAFSVTYTLIGGIEAVIWTDVIQVIVLMGGALLTLVMIGLGIKGSPDPLLTNALSEGKMEMIKTGFVISDSTIWVVIIGGLFANLITYSSDQTIVQRYLTTKDEQGAKRSAWTNALLMIPSTLIFFSVGTGLYLYYSAFPQKLDAFTTNTDAIFPWFIVHELPNGISGLLIAGLFSAAMSSLSSSINSAGTVFTTDFIKRFNSEITATRELFVARISTLGTGILGISFALWMASADVSSLWDQFFKVIGLFTGGLGGVFLLGFISKKANGWGAIIGLICSACVQYMVSVYTDFHVFLYAATGMISCMITGYLFSLVFPMRQTKL